MKTLALSAIVFISNFRSASAQLEIPSTPTAQTPKTQSIFPASVAEIYNKVIVDDHDQLHIVTVDGSIITPRMEKGQTGFKSPAISPDKRAAGWLALYSVPGVTSALPMELVICKNGKTLHRFRGRLPIWSWKFLAKGRQVAYVQDTLHFSVGGNYELHDTESGRLIASYNGEPQPNAPKWVHVIAMYK